MAKAEEWIVKEPGVIVMSGTRFSVRYEMTARGPAFIVSQDDNRIGSTFTLDTAKMMARDRHNELASMGLA